MFECQQCGECCKKYAGTLKASVEDIERWKREGREDILEYVYVFEFDGIIIGGDLWFDPKTGEEIIGTCPFLKKSKGKFICLIHDTKPTVCKEYPFNESKKPDKSRINECKGLRVI